jgi:hypothetical protein
MCFNKELTFGFTVFSGLIAAWILSGQGIWKIEAWRRLRIASCFIWFALMEFLQFGQYLVLNDCTSTLNIFWTLFGWVHISFQPLFSNLAFSGLDQRNTQKERDHTWTFIRNFCIATGALMSARIILPYFITPTQGTGGMFDLCTEAGEGFCAERTCATTGVFHVQWTFRLLKAGYALPNIAMHFMNMFVTPMLMGQSLGAIVLFATGPGIALLFPGAKDGERAAIWCFFSIAEAFLTVLTQYFAVRIAMGKSDEKAKEQAVKVKK